MTTWRVDCIVGARPNFVKIAPILRALAARGDIRSRLIHTGQHYDLAMNAVFFAELAIPTPNINLEVGSGTNTEQTARIMIALEGVLAPAKPDMLIVVGDVNSTLAASLLAAKLRIPIAHVEAGLRSHDRTMPEEINRLVTDRLADLLLTTERSAADQLVKEGVEPFRIHFVGNVMIDSLMACLPRAIPAVDTISEYAPASFTGVGATGFGFVTLHRPSNVDDPAKLAGLLEAFCDIALELPLLFAIHPRTRTVIDAAGLSPMLESSNIIATPPLSYLRAIGLMRSSRIVITDSGGVQEETTALGVPCLTVRDNTERPITITEGTNTLVGSNPAAVSRAARTALGARGKRGRIPELWDGRAAERIAEHVVDFLARRDEPVGSL